MSDVTGMNDVAGMLRSSTPPAAAIGPEHLLRLIRTGQATSRGALARLTGMSRSTIAQRVDALVDAGYVRDRGRGESAGGRPPILLEFDGSRRFVLTAVIERSEVRVGIVNFAGAVIERRRRPVGVAEGPDVVLGVITEEFRSILGHGATQPSEVSGIGISVPAPVEHATGRPIEPTIMPGWHACPIRERLEESFALPVFVDNDANLMGLAEYAVLGSGVTSMIYVRASDGIGAGLVLDGRLFRGAVGAAGALGHTAVDGCSKVCTCGNVGCLAAIAGGAAVAAQLRSVGERVADAAEVVSLVRSGHLAALQLLRTAGRQLGRVLAGVVNLLDPGVLVIGGELVEVHDFLAGVREEVYRRSLPLAAGHLQIVKACLGEDAAIKGAASLVAEELLAPRALMAGFGGQ